MRQGGIIGKPNSPSIFRGSGLWRVDEVFRARTSDKWPIAIGSPFLGGFFAGIIDTNQSDAIVPDDEYQTPLRYALIVSPSSLQIDAQWRTSNATVNAARTRWNGLAAQEAVASSTFPAFDYCQSLSFPDDGASRWYLPALDELTGAYWNLKPTTQNNSTGEETFGTFPDEDVIFGQLFSTVPQRPPFTSGTPGQTNVADFQQNGNEEFVQPVNPDRPGFWSATWRSNTAWTVSFSSGAALSNFQTSSQRVRPFRRLILPPEVP